MQLPMICWRVKSNLNFLFFNSFHKRTSDKFPAFLNSLALCFKFWLYGNFKYPVSPSDRHPFTKGEFSKTSSILKFSSTMPSSCHSLICSLKFLCFKILSNKFPSFRGVSAKADGVFASFRGVSAKADGVLVSLSFKYSNTSSKFFFTSRSEIWITLSPRLFKQLSLSLSYSIFPSWLTPSISITTPKFLQ